MARQITLTIPEPLYLQAYEVAQVQNRLVADVLSDGIQSLFPFLLSTTSKATETQSSLTSRQASSLSSLETAEALAAVERLSTLFADVTINNLEEVLADPMLTLANI